MSKTVHRSCAAALVALMSLAAPWTAVTAHAEEKITEQPHWDPYRMQDLRDAGLDGTGVKVAIIDSAPDTSVPELRGADITVVDDCDDAAPTAESTAHGTAVTSLLASPDFGMVPEASFTVYQVSMNRESRSSDCVLDRAGDLSYLLNAALNDGADVILQTTYADNSNIDAFALLRAADMGVPVVIAVNNTTDGKDAGNADGNGSIGVGSMDMRDSTVAAWNRKTPGLTVMAPGGPISVRRYGDNGKLSVIDTTAVGNSFAAPLVAGALALARQKYPDAHGNQLIHALIATASQYPSHDKVRGYGNARPTALVEADPSQYPTTNPLMDKFPHDQRYEANLTDQQIADYRDGMLSPGYLATNDPYVYRGDDEGIITSYPDRSEPRTSPRLASPSPSPEPQTEEGAPVGPSTPPPSSAGESSSPAPEGGSGFVSRTPMIVGAAVAVMLLAGAALFLRSRNKWPS